MNVQELSAKRERCYEALIEASTEVGRKQYDLRVATAARDDAFREYEKAYTEWLDGISAEAAKLLP